MKRKLYGFIVFSLIMFVRCASVTDSETDLQEETAVITPSPMPTTAMTATGVLTVTATPLPLPPATFTPEPTATAIPPTATSDTTCLLDPQAILPVSEPLEDVILFLGNEHNPLANTDVLSGKLLPGARRTTFLWGLSADGQRVNRLTNDLKAGVAWYIPGDSALPLWLMSTNDLIVDEALIWQIPLPEECDTFLEGRNSEYKYKACGDFEISPDGKWASFIFGDYFGGWNTQSGLINLGTEEIQFPAFGAGVSHFLPNNERLTGYSWGEGGETWWANSLTGETRLLGSAGFVYWNEDETAFANEWSPYVGIGGAVWAYDVPTKSLFNAESSLDVKTNYPVWTPDGSLLYQQQPLTFTDTFTMTFGPQEVRLANIVTGEDHTLLGNAQSNYFLCGNSHPEECVWAGDWIQVRRVPYEEKPLYFEDYDACLLNGYCGDVVENLALNWRTGELAAWEDVAQLLPTPTPSVTAVPVVAPDMTSPPLYENEEMEYALYPGDDGRSIWCVPETGQAQVWVQDAEWFAYLP